MVNEVDKEQSYSLDLSVISDVNFKTDNDELDIAGDLQDACFQSYLQTLQIKEKKRPPIAKTPAKKVIQIKPINQKLSGLFNQIIDQQKDAQKE